MQYLSVSEARDLPGLRLVLSANVPGPWGEAAKALFRLRNVPFLPVAQHVFEANEELVAWTGLRNAPIAMYEAEPPRAGWLEILLLAERLGTGQSLLPGDPLERALALGLSTEICGPDGFGWCRRLIPLANHRGSQIQDAAVREDVLRDYGVHGDDPARAGSRLVSILDGLALQLERQRMTGSDYLVGDRLSACDVYWACFSQMVRPLPEQDCPMPAFVRERYNVLPPAIVDALHPVLFAHRDMIFEHHIGLPLEF